MKKTPNSWRIRCFFNRRQLMPILRGWDTYENRLCKPCGAGIHIQSYQSQQNRVHMRTEHTNPTKLGYIWEPIMQTLRSWDIYETRSCKPCGAGIHMRTDHTNPTKLGYTWDPTIPIPASQEQNQTQKRPHIACGPFFKILIYFITVENWVFNNYIIYCTDCI